MEKLAVTLYVKLMTASIFPVTRDQGNTSCIAMPLRLAKLVCSRMM